MDVNKSLLLRIDKVTVRVEFEKKIKLFGNFTENSTFPQILKNWFNTIFLLLGEKSSLLEFSNS